jgi:hypothetical protein
MDILIEEVGATDSDLGRALAAALKKDRALCAAYGRSFSWRTSAEQFEAALVPLQEASISPAIANGPVTVSLTPSLGLSSSRAWRPYRGAENRPAP